MLFDFVFPVLALLVFVPIVAALYGMTRWQAGTVAVRADLEASGPE